uniref:Peptidase S1 domain-containing protein n=1 Tax=Steinernema glaseri TaxID=37863 RepID=A0A1I7ZGJ4_9BILA
MTWIFVHPAGVCGPEGKTRKGDFSTISALAGWIPDISVPDNSVPEIQSR